MDSKRGFSLVEIMCTIAIVLILLSVTALGVTDHLNNAKKTSEVVLVHYKGLEQIDGEAFGDDKGHSASIGSAQGQTGTGTADASSGTKNATGNQVNKTMSGGISNELSDAANTPAQADVPDEQKEDLAREDAINSAAQNLSNFASQHDVSFLPGTEDLLTHLATAEVDAKAMYDAGGYSGARYFTYCPATGVTQLANGNGKSMECKDGQNLIRASLDEAGAAATPGCNVRNQMDSNFLNDPNKVIYIGVNKTKDGTYQIVPNVCIDVNGNFNSVITHRHDAGTGWVSTRETFDAENLMDVNGRTANFNSYVNYVTNASGEMLDLRGYDMSQFTTRRSTSAQNDLWKAYVQTLRTSY
jgi:prepilin-type N-terminal cleavage/methylation domain-containing protein